MTSWAIQNGVPITVLSACHCILQEYYIDITATTKTPRNAFAKYIFKTKYLEPQIPGYISEIDYYFPKISNQ